jgi:MFS family permease
MQPPHIENVQGRVTALGDELWRDGRGWVFLVVSLGWFLSIGGRLVFPALVPHVRVALGMSLSTAGGVLTALWLAYALTQFPGGLLGDRVGERAILATSMAVSGCGLLVAGTASGLGAFVGGTVLFGVGSGLFSTTRMTVLSDVYPAVSGTAIGLSQAVGNVGTTLLPVLAGVVAVTAGWRGGLAMLVLPVFVTVVALWRVVPRRTHPPASNEAQSLRAVLDGVLQPTPLLVAGMMLAMSMVYQGFTSFYPTYLVTEKALDGETASILFGLFFATGVLVQPLAGLSADTVGPKRTFAGCILVAIFGLVALPFVDGVGALAALTVLLGVQLGFWAVANSFAITVMPEAVQGSGFGLVRTSYLVFAAMAPAGMGILAEVGLFDESFVLLACVAGCALLLGGRLPGAG